MIDLTLKNEIEKLVADIFSKKEDSDKKDMLTDALRSAKTKLEEASDAITSRDTEIEGLTSKLEESASTIDGMTLKAEEATTVMEEVNTTLVSKEEELVKANEDLETEKAKVVEHASEVEKKDVELSTVKKEFETVSAELEQIKKDAIVKERMSALEEAGLLRSDDEGVATQKEKVAEFSDEEYAAYKEELESVKASITKALKENANTGDGTNLINLEGDGETTVKDIGEALTDLFYGDKEGK
jgi:chromosome segregation ATPase